MIVTVDELREMFGFSFPVAQNSYYSSLLQASEEAVLKYADIEIGVHEEYFDGGNRIYVLTHCPVLRIGAVTVNGSDVEYRYEKRPHALILRKTSATGADTVKVEYESGWELGSVPYSLKAAIAMTTQHMAKLQSSKQIGVLSRSTEGGSESIDQNIPPLAVQRLLDRNRTGIAL